MLCKTIKERWLLVGYFHKQKLIIQSDMAIYERWKIDFAGMTVLKSCVFLTAAHVLGRPPAMGEILKSDEYQSFRSSIPFKRIVVDDEGDKCWGLYDAGPRSVRCPLVCLPPASGTGDVFFKQVLALSAAGYRVIAMEYPVYWTLKEYVLGFTKILDHLQLDQVHVFGASLGGFLALKYAEVTEKSPRVKSVILCNAFTDTSIFRQTSSAPTFWMMPAVVLKKMVMGNFDRGLVEKDIADSIDFMVDRLDSIGQQELASRLTLNCMNSYVEPQKLSYLNITIMDVYDESALSQGVREEVYKCFPDGRRAHMKSGGNFPYLSRCDEVNVYIQIHLQKYLNTRYSAMELRPEIIQQLKDAESATLPTSENRELEEET